MSTYARERRAEPPADDEHALVGAYALNAVEPAERAAFEEHLAGCPLCSADVPAFREILARMALESQAAPPPDLVGRTLVRARSTRQDRRRAGLPARLLGAMRRLRPRRTGGRG